MFQAIGKAASVAVILALVTPALAQNAAAPSQQSPDQWRASKLVGVSIYGPDNKTVGKISDLLMSKDGKVQLIVIGIGGILGIGEKDVAVPYDQVKFTDEPVTPPAPAAGAVAPAAPNTNNMAAGSTAGNTMAGGNGTMGGNMAGASVGMAPAGSNMGAGAGAPAGAAATDPAANRSTSYPDHGTVSMTADQLKNAPTFQYAK